MFYVLSFCLCKIILLYLRLQNIVIIVMNVFVKSLFFLIKDDKVLVCDTNLKDFFNGLPDDIRGLRGYDYYYRRFKACDCFNFEFNKDYVFQKMVFPKKNDIEKS